MQDVHAILTAVWDNTPLNPHRREVLAGAFDHSGRIQQNVHASIRSLLA